MSDTGDARVVRFSVRERVVHWAVALAFVYAALTGLALWSPRLYWLGAVLGGGTTIRGWHPWGGVIFAGVFALMFVGWHRPMRLDPDDRRWLKMMRRYAAHDFGAMPGAGRFNGGQKALFWLQALNLTLLAATGIVLWFPESMSRTLREIAVLIHPAAAIAAIGGLIVHVYMGTAATPGAFRGMTQGWVSARWAASHHPRWQREREGD
jgi:formate dehydrogenase subunit gamma